MTKESGGLQSLVIRRLERRAADGISRFQKAIMKGPVTVDYDRVVEKEAGKRDAVSFLAELKQFQPSPDG